MRTKRERILELLERYAEAKDSVSIAELCADCPELCEDLTARIRFLGQLDALVTPASDPDDTVAPGAVASVGSWSLGGLPAGVFPVIPGYDLLGELGGGGMGTVYKARHRELGRIVALKVIREGMAGPDYLQRFEREAKAGAKVSHPNIVQVYDFGRWRDGGAELPYLAMEFIEGGDLEHRLKHERLTPTESARLLRLLARAVAELHDKGIIHRDLKPANVLLAPSANEPGLNFVWGCPKLTDFGLARNVSGTTGSITGSLVGTPGYMAPEQAEASPSVGPAADVHGLGAILYRLLTGRVPFEGENIARRLKSVLDDVPVAPSRVSTDVPAALDALCMACLAKKPADRPSVAEVIEALDRIVAPSRTQIPLQPRKPFWTRRRVLVAGLMTLPVLVGLAWGVWSLQQGPQMSASPPKLLPLKVTHFEQRSHKAREQPGAVAVEEGLLGHKSMRAWHGDQVTIEVKISDPAYLYLLAFNADGAEQLLWPTSRSSKPELVERLQFPRGKRFNLDDEPRGGLQVFVALASRSPLPSYETWKRQRGEVAWRRHEPGTAVWEADDQGVWQRGSEERGSISRPLGAPPLEELCERLKVGGVETVEAVAFPVLPRGSER